MAIVQPKSQRWRLLLAHAFLLSLCAAVLFPFLVVVSVSLRPGNFASGSLIPSTISLEHWRYVLGLPVPGPTASPCCPICRCCAGFGTRSRWPSSRPAWTLLLSTTASYALARIRFAGGST